MTPEELEWPVRIMLWSAVVGTTCFAVIVALVLVRAVWEVIGEWWRHR